MKQLICGWLLALALGSVAQAHDTWVQANTTVVRVGDAAHVELALGNHGNEHRDFKLAGKPDLAASTLDVILPSGQKIDLKPRLTDQGYAPSEGFFVTRFVPAEPGFYIVGHTCDKVVSYAPTRSIKSVKTCFIASQSLDNVPHDLPGFDRPLGHPLELIPTANPVIPMGAGIPMSVRLEFRGKPLVGQRVSFIPRGVTLADDFDPKYERKTDEKGEARFAPEEGNYYLVVAHHEEPTESGPNYKQTKYSATLVVLVPQQCPCCE